MEQMNKLQIMLLTKLVLATVMRSGYISPQNVLPFKILIKNCLGWVIDGNTLTGVVFMKSHNWSAAPLTISECAIDWHLHFAQYNN